MKISPISYSSLNGSQKSGQQNNVNSKPLLINNKNQMLPVNSQVQFTGIMDFFRKIVQENAAEIARLKKDKLVNEIVEAFSKATVKHQDVMYANGKTVANSINYLETVFGKRHINEIKFDKNGNFMRHTKYEYVPNSVNNEILKTTDYDASGRLISETAYEYEYGKIARTVDRDFNGNPLKSTSYNYGSDGLCSTLDRDANGQEMKEIYYRGVNAPILSEKVFGKYSPEGFDYEQKYFDDLGKVTSIIRGNVDGAKTYRPDYTLSRFETGYSGGNKVYNYHEDGKTISSIIDKDKDIILENNPDGKAIFTRQKLYRFGGTVDMHVGTQEIRYSADGSKIIGKRYIVPRDYDTGHEIAIDTTYGADGKTVTELKYLVGTRSQSFWQSKAMEPKTLLNMKYDEKTGGLLEAVKYDKHGKGNPISDSEWAGSDPYQDFKSTFLNSLKNVNKEKSKYANDYCESFEYLLTNTYSYGNKNFIKEFAGYIE